MTDCFKHRYLETPFNHGWKSQSLLSWSVLVMAWHVGRTPSIRWWSLCPTDGFRCPTDMGKVEIGINHETDTWLDIGESHTPQRIWIPYGFDNIVILMSRKQSEMTRIREDIISFLYRWIQISHQIQVKELWNTKIQQPGYCFLLSHCFCAVILHDITLGYKELM